MQNWWRAGRVRMSARSKLDFGPIRPLRQTPCGTGAALRCGLECHPVDGGSAGFAASSKGRGPEAKGVRAGGPHRRAWWLGVPAALLRERLGADAASVWPAKMRPDRGTWAWSIGPRGLPGLSLPPETNRVRPGPSGYHGARGEGSTPAPLPPPAHPSRLFSGRSRRQLSPVAVAISNQRSGLPSDRTA